MRHCRVLLRKTEGLAWPPLEVMHEGERLTLEGLFRDSGVALEVVRSGPDLVPSLSNRPFGRADLRAAMSSTRRAVPEREGEWVAVVLVVPRICESTTGRAARPLGVTFGREDLGRDACAIAADTLGSDPRGLLRTLAHELGHLFNLGHPGEGAEPFDPDARNTVMVPTDRLSPPGRCPEPAEFRFTMRQRDWLTNIPEPFVRPGELPFGARPKWWPAGRDSAGRGVSARWTNQG
jgi:hypothetical protein